MNTDSVAFPLTPALSPSAGEREPRTPLLEHAERAGFTNALPAILPLLRRGEKGRGENSPKQEFAH